MTDYEFYNITEKIITILKILLLVIFCGIGLLFLITGIAVALRWRRCENMSNETDTQNKINEIMEAMQDLLLSKNRLYGNSALNPKHIFYKGDAVNSILIRLDDKLGRIMANTD